MDDHIVYVKYRYDKGRPTEDEIRFPRPRD
jgi:hypothetical protein